MLLPLFQPLDGTGRQPDDPPAPAGLGLADFQLAPLGRVHRPEDLQRPGALVEVLPHEPADLTSPQSGGQLRVEEVPPDLAGVHRFQEGVHLRPVQDLLGFAAGFGHGGAVRGIAGDDVVPLRVFETAVEHGVDAAHHGVGQLVSELRVVVDAALPFEPGVQPLDVRPRDPGDDLAAQVRLDVAADILLVAAQGVGPQGGEPYSAIQRSRYSPSVMRLSSVSCAS